MLVSRHRHCPLLSSIIVVVHRVHGRWCVVVCGGSPHIVIRRCPCSWPCSSIVVMVICCLLPALSSSFVRARSGEERAVYLPGLSFCNAKRTLMLSLTSITPAFCRALSPHSWHSWVGSCIALPMRSLHVVLGGHHGVVWSSVRWRWTTNGRCLSFHCHVAVGDVAAGLSVIMGMEGSVYVSSPRLGVLVMGIRSCTAPAMMTSSVPLCWGDEGPQTACSGAEAQNTDMGILDWVQHHHTCHDIHNTLLSDDTHPDGRKPIVAHCRSGGDDGGRSSSSVAGGLLWPSWWRSPVVQVVMMVGAHHHLWWAFVVHCCSLVVVVCGCRHWWKVVMVDRCRRWVLVSWVSTSWKSISILDTASAIWWWRSPSLVEGGGGESS